MKDIKFRVWDGVSVTQVTSAMWFNDKGELKGTQHLKFMQLTALRSTSGEEIYNNMIVKSSYVEKHYLVDMFDYFLMSKLASLPLEIVGNIYENNDLLFG